MMHYLNEERIAFFRSLIGKELIAVWPYLDGSGSMTIWEGAAYLFLVDNIIRIPFDFFETEEGDCYYNYEIKDAAANSFPHLSGYVKKIKKTIRSISIYGRNIPAELHSWFREVQKPTHDLFVFEFTDHSRMMMTFHYFFPEIMFEFDEGYILASLMDESKDEPHFWIMDIV
jgi:hypothetical protein